MNLKACTFESLALVSLGFGRGAQVGENFTFGSEIYFTAQASTLGVFIFYLVRFRPWDPTKTLDIWKKTKYDFNNAKQR